MPLSPPAPRRPLHLRRIECQGFRRDDGLWDVEARLVDTKSYAFENHDRGGMVQPGEPLHEMMVRVTIDDDFLIHAVEAVTEAGPFNGCGAVAPSFSGLAGLRIGKGFTSEVRRRFGGVRGCTHIVELFGPLATTAFQTVFAARERRAGQESPRERPRLIDQCHAMAADGPVVARLWPDFYTGAAPEERPGGGAAASRK